MLSRNATWISVTLGESYTSILHQFPGSLGQSSSQIVKKTVKMCAVLRWVRISICFWEKMDCEFSVPKTKRTIQTFINDRSKSKHLSWYGGAAEQTAWVTSICAKVFVTWRHVLGFVRSTHLAQRRYPMVDEVSCVFGLFSTQSY